MKTNLKEILYNRLKHLEEALDKPVPEWYNTHDFQSGYVTGISNMLKEEVEWLSNLLHTMEQE